MFDIKLIIILIFGICLIKLFEYDERVTHSKKILYFLLPFALVIVLIYDNYQHIFLSPAVKDAIKFIALATLIFSIYIYFSRKSEAYEYRVYSTSIYIIWAMMIIFGLIFIYDNEMLVKLGIFKIVLYGGLVLSLL